MRETEGDTDAGESAPASAAYARGRQDAARQAHALGSTMALQGAVLLMISMPLVFIGSPVVSVAVGVAGAVSLALGIRHFQRGRLLAERSQQAELEQLILAATSDCGGTITAVQAATRAGVSVAEAQETLERLVIHGHGDVSNDESDGTIVYRFPSCEERPRSLPVGDHT
ncbi:MAG: hypothetical protein HYV63_05905 [Candidatus Schekmanbacteria bacterium]|nr:hypothetical protein [Candidatus Schekmanbacteria bacterium]